MIRVTEESAAVPEATQSDLAGPPSIENVKTAGSAQSDHAARQAISPASQPKIS
jgi:hypothetical protein